MGAALKLLLDTHAILWWFSTSPLLSELAIDAINDEGNQIFVSAVSSFEIATKFTLGKLPEGEQLAASFDEMTLEQGFEHLPISTRDGASAGRFPFHHRDPFDRILAAQVSRRDMTLVSRDAIFDHYGVTRLW